MGVMIRTALGVGLLLASASPAWSQAKRSLICKEQVSVGLAQGEPGNALKADAVPRRTF